MNLPNKITISRILLIPVFMLLAFPYPAFLTGLSGTVVEFFDNWHCLMAFIVFVIAASTDALDGHIARKYNMITDFGKFLDPIADKLLVTSALLCLCAKNKIYVWATMIILIREFVVTGLRLVAGTKGKVIAAGMLGKIKTVSQTIALAVLLAVPVFSGTVAASLQVAGDIILFISVVLTIVSGIQYLCAYSSVLEDK